MAAFMFVFPGCSESGSLIRSISTVLFFNFLLCLFYYALLTSNPGFVLLNHYFVQCPNCVLACRFIFLYTLMYLTPDGLIFIKYKTDFR